MHWTNLCAELIDKFFQTWEMWEDGHIVARVKYQWIFINQRFIFDLFNVSNEGDVNPPHASKVVALTKWGPIIVFVNAYVGTKQWAVVQIQDAYWLQFAACCKLFIGKRRSPISIIKLLLHFQMLIKELLSISAILCSHNLVLSSFDGQNTRGMLQLGIPKL
jgi:hypothetical protein